MEQGALFAPMAITTVVVELTAPIALLGGRIRSAWVAAAWTMHAAIAALMFVVFPYPPALVAFAPFYPLERLRRRGRLTSDRGSAAILRSWVGSTGWSCRFYRKSA